MLLFNVWFAIVLLDIHTNVQALACSYVLLLPFKHTNSNLTNHKLLSKKLKAWRDSNFVKNANNSKTGNANFKDDGFAKLYQSEHLILILFLQVYCVKKFVCRDKESAGTSCPNPVFL